MKEKLLKNSIVAVRYVFTSALIGSSVLTVAKLIPAGLALAAEWIPFGILG